MYIRAQLQEITDQNPFTRLGDAVYTILYQNLIQLRIPSDAMLSDTALAKELSISRTPVRDALLRLQKDGLLIQSKGRSYQVAPLNKEECRSLMEARIAVEGQTAFWAAERITDEQQAYLSALQNTYAAACSDWDTNKLVEADQAFHQSIVDAANNPFLSEIYAQLSPRVLHYRHFLFSRMKRECLEPIMKVSVRHHESVLNAIRLGLGSLAREQLERDIAGMSDIIGNWQ